MSNSTSSDSDIGFVKKSESDIRKPQVLEILKLSDGSYKYSVIYQKKEDKYTFIVPDDNSAFSRVVAGLPQ